MSRLPFKAVAAELTARIDQLVSALGASGADLYERAGSIQHLLDEYELRQLRSIAVVKRDYARDLRYKFTGNTAQFIETCHWLIPRLEALRDTCQKQQREPSAPKAADAAPDVAPGPAAASKPSAKAAWWVSAGLGVVCLLVLPFFCVHSVEHSEWPSGRTYVEEESNWPVIVFWAATASFVSFQMMRSIAKRRYNGSPNR